MRCRLEATKRMSRGFSVQGAYTWSKSLDQASAIALGGAVPNVFDLRTQWGRSDFDARHVMALSWIWDLPSFAASAAPVRWIVGGWQLNGLLTARTGQPLNIVTGQDNALSGTPNQRPNQVGNPHLSTDRPRSELVAAWFDRTAFANPAAGTYGNFGRNVLTAPANFSLNAGVFKSFPIPLREWNAVRVPDGVLQPDEHAELQQSEHEPKCGREHGPHYRRGRRARHSVRGQGAVLMPLRHALGVR